MTDSRREKMLAHLRALREEYAQRLPRTLQSLREQASRLGPDAGVDEWSALHRQLHKLAGSAGSFGYGDLGARARELEVACQPFVEGRGEGIDCQALLAKVQALTPETPNQNEPETSAPSALAPQPGNRVYLLEDDELLAGEITLTLENFGYQVTHYDTLEAAEEPIVREPPDFLLADVMFSDSGREAPALIRQLQGQLSEPLPVVFISARDDFNSYLAAVRAGAVGYFVKPLDMPRLVDCLESHLNLKRAAPYRVLIVDDDEVLARRYELVLEGAGMRVEVINDPRHVLKTMRRFRPEMVLLDLNLPDCRGYELAQVIRLNPDWLRVAIAYLSSEQDETAQIAAVRHGGEDFLTKPISDARLVSAVAVRAARSRQLSDAIDRDSLTGLLKHGRIKDQLGIEVARAARQGKTVSVAMVDLDLFKRVNDTYGHAMGDRVIRALSQLMRQRLRQTDSVGRYGGEEFVAIMPDCDLASAEGILDELRESFARLSFQADGEAFSVTLSAGVAATNTWIEADGLLERADRALYDAKERGRNRICTER